jgi:uncharacterized membrane protein HdeD (DUF308 family)
VPTQLADPHPSDEAAGGLLAGFGLILVGGLALSLSVISSLMTVMLLGIALAVGGGVALREAHAAHRGWLHLVIPLLVLALGLALILRPLSSLRVVTPLLMAVFLLDGLFLILVALRDREGAWVAELVTGAVNLTLGVLLALQWRSAGMGIAGTLTGLYLLSRGGMFLATSAVRYAHLRRTQARSRRRLR